MKRVPAVVSFEVVDFAVEDEAAPRNPLPDAAGDGAKVRGVVLRLWQEQRCREQLDVRAGVRQGKYY